MSLLGWFVGAMIVDEFGHHQDELDRHERELKQRDRRISDLEFRLRSLESRGLVRDPGRGPRTGTF